QKENIKEKLPLIGFSCFYIFFGISRIFLYLSDLQINGIFQNGVFIGDVSDYGPLYEILFRCFLVSSGIGFVFLYFMIEKSVFSTKYLLTTITVVITISHIVLPFKFALDIEALSWNFKIILTVFVLYKFTRWAQVEFKAIGLFLFVSITLLLNGVILNYTPNKELISIPLFIDPLFIIIGIFVAMIPLLINPSRLPQTQIYWLGFSIFSIISFIGFIFMAFPILFTELFIFNIANELFILILLIYMNYRLIKDVKSLSVTLKTPEIRKEKPDVFKAFTKPQNLTEEEDSISKEKKICLVCKGELSRKNYICPECKTFYCIKCSDTLSNIENACWVCNTPFNESKPSKPFTIIETEVGVDINEK
ncbi:MAG: hypothetical protein ACW990_18685, partial [Promethearchaeota archaeon]